LVRLNRLLLETVYPRELRPAMQRSPRVLATESVKNYVDENGPFHGPDHVVLQVLKQEYPYVVLEKALEPPPTALAKMGTVLNNHFHLHSQWQDIVLSDPANPSNDTITPDTATFSYSDDRIKKLSTWKVNGTLYYEVMVSSNTLITRFVPSVYANEVRSSVSSNDVDQLVFRTSFETRNKEWCSLRYGAFYTTDSQFKSGQVGGELELEIISNPLRMGGYRGPLVTNCPNFMDIAWRGFVHFEGGHVTEPGNNSLELGSSSTYYRAGPYIQINLFPLPRMFDWALVEKTTLQDYEKLNSGVRSTRLLTTELDYLFGKDKNVSLGVIYKYGRDQFSAKQENNISIALGLQF
jgi:hypothetical protein